MSQDKPKQRAKKSGKAPSAARQSCGPPASPPSSSPPCKRKRRKGADFLHDHLFRDIYSRPRYSLDIFRLALTPEQFALFDWAAVKCEMNTFIDKDLREKRTDLLFSVCLKNSHQKIGILFLLEHKSRQDRSSHKQLLSYQTNAYMRWDFPVCCLVVYNGKAKEWRLSLDFHGSLKGFTGDLKRLFEPNVLNFRYKLLNLQKLDLKKRARGLTSHPILFILQNIWNLDEKKVKELFILNQKAGSKDRRFFIDRAIDYIRRFDPSFSWKILRDIEKKTTKEEHIMPLLSSLETAQEKGFKKGMQTGLQQGRQEGMQQGRQEGMQQGRQEGMQTGLQQGRRKRDQEVICNMLQKKMDISLISSVTGLSEKEIKKLQNGS